MVPQIDAQNSSSKEGAIGTWVPLNRCKVGVGWVLDFASTLAKYQKVIMYVFQLEVKFFKDPPLPHTHPKLVFKNPN
jgi:hypothetical protein